MPTENQAKEDLKRELGRVPREIIWNHLMKEGYVEEYVNDFGSGEYGEDEDELEPIEVLVNKYHSLDKSFPGNNLNRGTGGPKEPVRLDTDQRGKALSEILEHYTDKIPQVVDFRKRYLKRVQLESVEDAARWLEKKMKVEALDLEKGGFTFDDGGIVEAPISRLVKPDGALASLHHAARAIEGKFSPACDRRAAIICALTGILNLTRGVVVWRVNHPIAALSRIELQIDPRVAPADVAKIYREQRDKYAAWVFGKGKDNPGKMISDKHLRLAVFALRRIEGGSTWPDLIRSWNENCQGKHDKYQMDRQGQAQFGRDVRDAWGRVTGLPWKRRQEINEHFGDPLWELGLIFNQGISVQEPYWQRFKPQE